MVLHKINNFTKKKGLVVFMGFRYFVALVVFTGLVGLMGCTATTQPTQSLTCEQAFDRALERGVSYTDALGSYTQCLLNRGDTITQVTGR